MENRRHIETRGELKMKWFVGSMLKLNLLNVETGCMSANVQRFDHDEPTFSCLSKSLIVPIRQIPSSSWLSHQKNLEPTHCLLHLCHLSDSRSSLTYTTVIMIITIIAIITYLNNHRPPVPRLLLGGDLEPGNEKLPEAVSVILKAGRWKHQRSSSSSQSFSTWQRNSNVFLPESELLKEFPPGKQRLPLSPEEEEFDLEEKTAKATTCKIPDV